MNKIAIAGLSTALLIGFSAGQALALDVTTKKMLIKEHPDPAKRQIQLQSKDAAILFAGAGSPDTEGASVHVYSSTDDFCLQIPAGPLWVNKKDKDWKYKNTITKNQVQWADGKLKVKIKSGVTYTLADDLTQGDINALVQLGTGTQLCLRCTAAGAKKNDEKKFITKDCVAATCDAPPSTCLTVATTTTTTSTTTTTQPPLPGAVAKAVLPRTNGNFNFNLTPGAAGAELACDDAFGGSHVCNYAELQAAEAAGDLDGIRDPNTQAEVTGLWVVDGSEPFDSQCPTSLGGGTPWTYATGHIAMGGSNVSLDNQTGTLGALNTFPAAAANRNCHGSGGNWILCCQ